MESKRLVIGIDEVGRGPLAGPVVVCAVALPARLTEFRGVVTRHNTAMKRHSGVMRPHSGSRKKLILRDSKKLSARQREAWFAFFKTHADIRYAIARVYPRQIEKQNISRAANLAAYRALWRLTKSSKLTAKISKVFLDGGLYIKNKAYQNSELVHVGPRKGPRLSATTVIRGDEKIPAISIASILAKVTRDRMMVRLARVYPQYGFDRHKGYGTRAHLAAIKKFGPSPVHRRTFLA